jgi:murein tripeptide amidase MpaA
MRLLPAAVLSALLVPGAAGQPARYDGHKVVRVSIHSPRDLQTMLALAADVWSERIDAGPADFRVHPDALPALDATGITYSVLVEDVQALIDAERLRLTNPVAADGWFDDFKDNDAINARLAFLAALRPDIAQEVVIGTTIEGRVIRGIRISNDAANPGRCKPGLVFGATQHAREWIAPMVTMYLAEALVSGHGADPVITDLVDRAEFFVLPVVNADGYVYTWGPDRLWRKNRRDIANSPCFGVDLNRNWGYQWGSDNGSSGDPCSNNYRGTAPFSEPEAAALRDFVLARPQVRYQHDMHSYGQLLLQPWGYTAAPPPDHATYQALGAAMAGLIKAEHGKTYVYGPTYTKLYPISGGAGDWAWGAENVYSFLFELRGDPGGFILPPEQIIPNSQEILAAAVHLSSWIADRFPFKADFNGDCVYSIDDFIAFQTGFAVSDPRADMDGDGALTIDDFIVFQTLFAIGG